MTDMQIKDYKSIIDWYCMKVKSQSREIETLRARVRLMDRIMLEHNHSRNCSLHESAIEYLNQ